MKRTDCISININYCKHDTVIGSRTLTAHVLSDGRAGRTLKPCTAMFVATGALQVFQMLMKHMNPYMTPCSSSSSTHGELAVFLLYCRSRSLITSLLSKQHVKDYYLKSLPLTLRNPCTSVPSDFPKSCTSSESRFW